MRVYCALITLLLFSGAQLWETVFAGECSAVNSGFDISGGSNDISNQLGTTLGQCCDLCNANAACKAYVWVKSDGHCFLKSVDQPTSTNDGLISGKRGPATSTPDQCLSVNSGLDISPGENDISLQTLSLAKCCESCNANSGCKAFVWVKNDARCYLKSVDQPTAPNNDVVSGKRGPATSSCSTNDGFDISGGSHDISNQLGLTLAACCDYCKSNSACKAFVWVKSSGQCFLKDVDQPTSPNSALVSGIPAGSQTPGCNAAGVKCSGYGDATCCKDLSCGRSSPSEFTCSQPPACANAGNGFFCNKSPKQPQNCCSGRCYGYECDQSNDGERCYEDRDCTAYTSKEHVCVNRVCVKVSTVCSQNGAPCNPAVPGNNDQGACCFTNCRPNDADPSTGVCTNDPACTRTEGAPCGSRYDAPCCTNLNLYCLPPTAAAVAAGQDYYTCQKSTRTDCAVRTQACGQDGGNIQCCGNLRCEKPTSFEPTIYRCHEPPQQPICKSLGTNVQGYGGFACCSEHADTQTGACPFGQTCTSSTQYCQCPQRQYTSCQNDGDCCGPKCVDYRCT